MKRLLSPLQSVPMTHKRRTYSPSFAHGQVIEVEPGVVFICCQITKKVLCGGNVCNSLFVSRDPVPNVSLYAIEPCKVYFLYEAEDMKEKAGTFLPKIYSIEI